MSEKDWIARFIDSLEGYFQTCGLQECETHDTTGTGLAFESFQQKFSGVQGIQFTCFMDPQMST